MTEETGPVERTSAPRSYKWELLALLCLAFFFHQGDRAIFGVVATEIQEDLHLDKGQIGLVATILFWTIALMTPIAGYPRRRAAEEVHDHRRAPLLELHDRSDRSEPRSVQPGDTPKRGNRRERIVLRAPPLTH